MIVKRVLQLFLCCILSLSLSIVSYASDVYTSTDETMYNQMVSSMYNHYRYNQGQDYETAMQNAIDYTLNAYGWEEIPVAGEEKGYSTTISVGGGEIIMTLTETISALGETFEVGTSLMTAVGNMIVSTPILFIPIGLGIVGTGIALFQKLKNG